MRQCIAGDYTNSTAAVIAYLAANNEFLQKNLYLIGYQEDQHALFLTDHDRPLEYAAQGIFQPATIKRGTVSTKIGLTVASLEITWTPTPATYANKTWGPIGTTADPRILAQAGYYDNLPVTVWRSFVIPPGDANTLGAYVLFGGLIANAQVDRGKIIFTVNSYAALFAQQIPPNVIEITNILASYQAATPPPGLSQIPQFSVVAGSTNIRINGDETSPNPGQIFSDHTFDADGNGTGYLVFNYGTNATLGGLWSPIGISTSFTDGGGSHHNEFILYRAVPYPPTPGADTFYVSAAYPVTLAQLTAAGLPGAVFPYVPDPSQGL